MSYQTLSSVADPYLALGVSLFCAGALAGIPHGRSKRSGDLKRTELWRIAHLSTCLGGVSLIALALALERLFAGAAIYTLVPFTASAWCFFVACSLSGCLNKSWADDRSDAGVVLVYGLQVVAAGLSLLAVGAFIVTLGLRALS